MNMSTLNMDIGTDMNMEKDADIDNYPYMDLVVDTDY
jgi:hypothetical protein